MLPGVDIAFTLAVQATQKERNPEPPIRRMGPWLADSRDAGQVGTVLKGELA